MATNCGRPTQATVASKVDIGYLSHTSDSAPDNGLLESRFFPSKVGGKPAWLDLENIPGVDDIKCTKCSQPCVFLCQIYAPYEEKDTCFHRMIFVFLCMDPQCYSGHGSENFKVYRNQLKRDNQFYPFDPPLQDVKWRPDIKAESYVKICNVCGCRSVSHCKNCKTANYCCKEHQIVDWKAVHKADCGSNNHRHSGKVLLPLLEMLMEPEYPSDDEIPENERSDAEKLQEYEALANRGALGSLQGMGSVDEDLLAMAESKEDKDFVAFTSRVQVNPDQVLRYERGGDPLWVSASGKPETVPRCKYCGGERQFEFQILSQMLNHLGLDSVGQSVDWGVLAIFTCKDSCDDGLAYKEEYLWKQDFNE